MSKIYYQLREIYEDSQSDRDRRIYTFDTEDDANQAYEFFVKLGVNPKSLYIKEYEAK